MARALEKAVKIAGNASLLGERIGVSPQAVNQWLKRGRVPVERVLIVESMTGVARHELRPDIYPAPEADRPLANAAA